MRISKHVIGFILSKIDIVSLIGDYLSLKPSGQNYFAHCPWHDDEHPSFCVSPEKQIFHCFSCGKGGNAISFIEDYKHESFPQAVKELGSSLGINVGRDSKRFKPRHPLPKDDYVIMKIYDNAMKYFSTTLTDTIAGEKALKYLHSIGLTNDTINQFKIGFSPKKQVLAAFAEGKIMSKKLKPEQIAKSNLFYRDKKHHLHCIFSSHDIIVPITDRWNRTVAFVSIRKNSKGGYTSLLNNPVYNHWPVMFNVGRARQASRYSRTVILCENYLDAIKMYQLGIPNVIALDNGKLPTAKQMKELHYSASHIIICYERNQRGYKIADHTIHLLPQKWFTAATVPMPDLKKYNHKRGDIALHDYLKSAQESATLFRLRLGRAVLDLSSKHGRSVYIQQSAKIIANVSSRVAQNVYVNLIANRLKLDKNKFTRMIVNA